MEKAGEKRPWGLEQRLEFIEFRLFWEGGINRGDIIDRFNVSMPQASNDLTLYRELAPENLEYDSSEKRYLATAKFEPKLLVPNADRYLVQLKAIADNVIKLEDTLIDSAPSVDAMPIPHRRVQPRILKKLLETIRAKHSLSIYYHSMNAKRPDALWREITPHAFAYDGLRWHVRAYCHLENRFKDFILSRFLDVGDTGKPGAPPNTDHDWLTFFEVVLVPNPKLSKAQQRTIALDYEMKDGQMIVPVRCALLYYFNKRLRLDVGKIVDDPKETPIVVLNQTEFEQAVERATG